MLDASLSPPFLLPLLIAARSGPFLLPPRFATDYGTILHIPIRSTVRLLITTEVEVHSLLQSSRALLRLMLIVIHHHHHERAPSWSVAVSTSCLHRSLSWASRHAGLSPWLSGWRSAFRVRSQV